MASRVSIPKIKDLADLDDRGWVLIQNSDTGKQEVFLRCPGCGVLRDMGDHEIGVNGIVRPSILCEDCGYHVFARLEDWDGGLK